DRAPRRMSRPWNSPLPRTSALGWRGWPKRSRDTTEKGGTHVAAYTVSPWVAGLVLTSAVLHASWNALLKGGGDRLHSVTVMALASSLVSAAWAAFLPAPHAESWFYIGLS